MSIHPATLIDIRGSRHHTVDQDCFGSMTANCPVVMPSGEVCMSPCANMACIPSVDEWIKRLLFLTVDQRQEAWKYNCNKRALLHLAIVRLVRQNMDMTPWLYYMSSKVNMVDLTIAPNTLKFKSTSNQSDLELIEILRSTNIYH